MALERNRSAAPDGQLDGQVAIVTGGGGGIGRAIAAALADAGALVGVLDVNPSLVEQATGELGDAAVGIAVDCTDASAVASAVHTVEDRLGPVSILVQAAGIADPCPGDGLDPQAWMRTIDVNLTGAFNLLHACVPGMIERRSGSILHIASIAGHRGGQNRSVAYAASKGGLIAMTRALAAQLGPYGITVNSLSPGIVRTPLTTELIASMPDGAIRTAVPLGHEATPEDIAGAAAFLVGPAGAYVSAVDLVVDGGLSNTYRV